MSITKRIWLRLQEYNQAFRFMRTALRHHAAERGLPAPGHLNFLAKSDALKALPFVPTKEGS